MIPDHERVYWDNGRSATRPSPALGIRGTCDPWHMLSGASAAVVDEGDELRVIAALLGVDCYVVDPRSGSLRRCTEDADSLLRAAISATAYVNPFTGDPMSVGEMIDLCGFWRELVDSNRGIAGGLGFAFWKQGPVAPLLWSGSEEFRFIRGASEIVEGQQVAVWRAKAPADVVRELEVKNASFIEVEDGFLRSRGLGADCIPPLSITVDRLGAHFDPSRESDLENLIEGGAFDDELLGRARELRRVIVEKGLGKYERGASVIARPGRDRRVVLVTGQVEDDRAVIAGGCGLVSNLELLRRVREQAPDAFILYKPHPDVLAGHRRGAIPEGSCLRYADEVVTESTIASLIDIADEVHVNTSLAGFEALLRGKPVTTYGVPFYAGWGLTIDLGPVPGRRSARRSIDELVAATLLLYPRYLDPITGLPCPAEVVLGRLTGEDMPPPGMFVGMRRLQGKFMRRFRSTGQ